MDPLILNWLKDVGIATATLLVLGNVMARLLQSTIEFYRGVREDNKERNKQFATLLGINEAIAGQMDLTRQAIEHSARSSVEQDHAIRSNTEGMDTLRLDIVTRLDVLGKQITGARHDILSSLERARVGDSAVIDAQANASEAQVGGGKQWS